MNDVMSSIGALRHIMAAMDAGQVIKVSRQEVDLIKELYMEVAPGRRLNTACQSCIQMALSYLAAWAEQNGTTNKEASKKKKTKDGIQ